MTLDQRLTDAMHQVADDVTVPGVDLAAVRSTARTHRDAHGRHGRRCRRRGGRGRVDPGRRSRHQRTGACVEPNAVDV